MYLCAEQKQKNMKKLIKRLLFGKPIKTDYAPIKAGYTTIECEKISFNEWSENLIHDKKLKK